MKAIFTTLLDLKGPLLKHIEQIANSGQSVECYKLASSHTINGIASVAFGIDIDCFADSENPFRKYGLRIDEPSWKNTFRAFCFRLMPVLKSSLRIHLVDQEVEDFIYDMVNQSLEYREKNKIVRKDFLQLLIQLRNTATVQLDDEWENECDYRITSESKKLFTIDQIAAQAFSKITLLHSMNNTLALN